jgi:ADP-heptose:LPS heptosyltransferase
MKYSDCYIELLEEFACDNKMQLNRREGELIRTTDCVNKNIAGRTKVEHYQDNKETINEKTKQYYQDNKQEILEQTKQYREDNKTEILEKRKQYRIDNRQSINEKQEQKYNCFCGGKYTNVHKSEHFKSNKHKEFIRQLSETTTA